jgi:hypothetical protein
MKEHDDVSEYSKESGMYDERIFYKIKKAIGKFKDESTDEVIEKKNPDEVIESFVGIRSKCYTFTIKNNVAKNARGVNTVVVKKNITFDD